VAWNAYCLCRSIENYSKPNMWIIFIAGTPSSPWTLDTSSENEKKNETKFNPFEGQLRYVH
jgi:hypothetical protein